MKSHEAAVDTWPGHRVRTIYTLHNGVFVHGTAICTCGWGTPYIPTKESLTDKVADHKQATTETEKTA